MATKSVTASAARNGLKMHCAKRGRTMPSHHRRIAFREAVQCKPRNQAAPCCCLSQACHGSHPSTIHGYMVRPDAAASSPRPLRRSAAHFMFSILCAHNRAPAPATHQPACSIISQQRCPGYARRPCSLEIVLRHSIARALRLLPGKHTLPKIKYAVVRMYHAHHHWR